MWKTWKISPWISWQTHSFFFQSHSGSTREFTWNQSCKWLSKSSTTAHTSSSSSLSLSIKLICNLFQFKCVKPSTFSVLFSSAHSLPRQPINLLRRGVLSCVENRRWMRFFSSFSGLYELNRTLCQIFWQKAFVMFDFTQDWWGIRE